MKIPFNDLRRSFEIHKNEYENKVIEVLNSGRYILGEEVSKFEREFASKLGAKWAVAVDNGLNAISLGIETLGLGGRDEILVQANTYIATMLAVSHNNVKIIAAEPDEYYNMEPLEIERRITNKTKAVLITHMYGQAADMKEIPKICRNHQLMLMEDCAQAHFARYESQCVGTFGKMGFFSFYPTKNLGAFGDAGAIVTDDETVYEKLISLRNYGKRDRYYNELIGYNSRMDEIQAGLLRVKLKYMEDINGERTEIANQYISKISNPHIKTPRVRANATSIWHLFVVETANRDGFKRYLEEQGIATEIHYPIPPHLSGAYSKEEWTQKSYPKTEYYSNHLLSLPLYNGMEQEEIEHVINVVNAYAPEA